MMTIGSIRVTCSTATSVLHLNMKPIQPVRRNNNQLCALTAYSQKTDFISIFFFFFVLWCIKLFHLLKTSNRVHFLLVLGKLYRDIYSFLYFLFFFCMISVVLTPEDLKLYKSAASLALVIFFRALYFHEKIIFLFFF